MQGDHETSFLWPSATFVVELAVLLALFIAVVVWPLVDAVARRQWGYALAVVVLGPVGGLLWLTYGRRETSTRPVSG